MRAKPTAEKVPKKTGQNTNQRCFGLTIFINAHRAKSRKPALRGGEVEREDFSASHRLSSTGAYYQRSFWRRFWCCLRFG